MTYEFKMIRNAEKVTVKPVYVASSGGRRVKAEITVNDQYTHRFPLTSRISKHLDLLTPEQLGNRLTGGSFFFAKDESSDLELVDFRDGQYGGFVHTDHSISKFMETIGMTRKANLHRHLTSQRFGGQSHHDDGSTFSLRNVWSTEGVQVPGMGEGGHFDSSLSFKWNPFAHSIDSTYDLIRLVCENGAVGVTSFLNAKIPLFNRWEEHLDIASRQIQSKITTVVSNRVKQMAKERASIADCNLAATHAISRGASPGIDQSHRDRIDALYRTVSPVENLKHVYTASVFQSTAISSQLPSHLTNFDLWNIVTELRTHTPASNTSSPSGLDKLANLLMFNDHGNKMVNQFSVTAPSKSAFSSPDTAFFGVMA